MSEQEHPVRGRMPWAEGPPARPWSEMEERWAKLLHLESDLVAEANDATAKAAIAGASKADFESWRLKGRAEALEEAAGTLRAILVEMPEVGTDVRPHRRLAIFPPQRFDVDDEVLVRSGFYAAGRRGKVTLVRPPLKVGDRPTYEVMLDDKTMAGYEEHAIEPAEVPTAA